MYYPKSALWETSRSSACFGVKRIVDNLQALGTAQEVITMVNEKENKNSIEIALDESVRQFFSDTSDYLDDARERAIKNIKEEKEFL